MPDCVISTLPVPVIWISPAYDVSDAVAPESVYELFVATMVLLSPFSVMLGTVLSMIMLEPGKFACVNVLVCRLSSLFALIMNGRLVVSPSDDSTV